MGQLITDPVAIPSADLIRPKVLPSADLIRFNLADLIRPIDVKSLIKSCPLCNGGLKSNNEGSWCINSPCEYYTKSLPTPPQVEQTEYDVPKAKLAPKLVDAESIRNSSLEHQEFGLHHFMDVLEHLGIL